MAKGYWISFYEEIINPDGLAAYATLAGPAVEQHGGRFLIRGGDGVAKEGMANNRTVVVEFDSYQQAQDTYQSVEYQTALQKLDGAVKRHFRIVEGT